MDKDLKYFEDKLKEIWKDNFDFFKESELKLFYLKIMELIADEFGRGKCFVFFDSLVIDYCFAESYTSTVNDGYEMDIFTEYSAAKCIKIMGDKLDIVFNRVS